MTLYLYSWWTPLLICGFTVFISFALFFNLLLRSALSQGEEPIRKVYRSFFGTIVVLSLSFIAFVMAIS